MGVYEKLGRIQADIKVPKSLYNKFGNYNYRNAESIFNAAKPLLAKEKCTLCVSDDITEIGNRIYIKATAALIDIETSERIEVSALAREAETKKGMDESQITGSVSSYARKYALNGLFLLDDVKDADAMSGDEKDFNASAEKELSENASEAQKNAIKVICKKNNVSFEALLKANKLAEESMTKKQATQLLLSLQKKFGD